MFQQQLVSSLDIQKGNRYNNASHPLSNGGTPVYKRHARAEGTAKPSVGCSCADGEH